MNTSTEGNIHLGPGEGARKGEVALARTIEGQTHFDRRTDPRAILRIPRRTPKRRPPTTLRQTGKPPASRPFIPPFPRTEGETKEGARKVYGVRCLVSVLPLCLTRPPSPTARPSWLTLNTVARRSLDPTPPSYVIESPIARQHECAAVGGEHADGAEFGAGVGLGRGVACGLGPCYEE